MCGGISGCGRKGSVEDDARVLPGLRVAIYGDGKTGAELVLTERPSGQLWGAVEGGGREMLQFSRQVQFHHLWGPCKMKSAQKQKRNAQKRAKIRKRFIFFSNLSLDASWCLLFTI